MHKAARAVCFCCCCWGRPFLSFPSPRRKSKWERLHRIEFARQFDRAPRWKGEIVYRARVGKESEREREEGCIKSTVNNRLQPSPNISLLYAYHGHGALDRNLALYVRNVPASLSLSPLPSTLQSFDKLAIYSKNGITRPSIPFFSLPETTTRDLLLDRENGIIFFEFVSL